MQRWKKSIYETKSPIASSPNWTLVTQTSAKPVVESLTARTTQIMIFLLSLVTGVIFLSHLLSRHFTKFIANLEIQTREVPLRVTLQQNCPIPQSRFSELQSLAENVEAMTESLIASFQNERRLVQKESQHLKEKQLIIKDLHDGIGGIITNIAMLAQHASTQNQADAMKTTFQKIIVLAREGGSEVRSFMNSVESETVSWSDLVSEIKENARTGLEEHGVSVRFDVRIENNSEPPGIFRYTNIVRIAKEAFTNILKHAGASSVRVSISLQPNSFSLIIHDNGKGFDTTNTRRRGLANMASRAKNMSGKIDFSSLNGTKVAITIPLPQPFSTTSKEKP
jgi:signal transduction histidine kinase